MVYFMTHKSHGKQFKRGEEKYVLENEMIVSKVSKELSNHYNLYCWLSEYKKYE